MPSVGKEIDFDVMSDRCIAAGEAVMKIGSPERQAAMRVVLAILGREIAAGMSAAGMSAAPRARVGRVPARPHLN